MAGGNLITDHEPTARPGSDLALHLMIPRDSKLCNTFCFSFFFSFWVFLKLCNTLTRSFILAEQIGGRMLLVLIATYNRGLRCCCSSKHADTHKNVRSGETVKHKFHSHTWKPGPPSAKRHSLVVFFFGLLWAAVKCSHLERCQSIVYRHPKQWRGSQEFPGQRSTLNNKWKRTGRKVWIINKPARRSSSVFVSYFGKWNILVAKNAAVVETWQRLSAGCHNHFSHNIGNIRFI